ncbi:hypothetical protein MSG28_011223 [Choristoneura fumiferana]|uniref:Uncharacterized protein n=1 Tax=Choristoneura fumiferana TaxID=7141 RepID=A0ACC0KRJ7_CHOFU|nr:hypothetical protein MSG28_011223 [Choristoneura fumiferana]
MLTRLRFKRDFRLIVRCLSDKPSEGDGKLPETQKKIKDNEKETESSTDKIQALLKKESITKAADDVAQVIGGDIKKTEAELLSKVLGKIDQTSTSLSDLLIGMKVDHSKGGDERVQWETRGEQVKRFVSKSQAEQRGWPRQGQSKPMQNKAPVKEKRSEPLGIFKAQESNYGTKLEVWESLKQREVMLATSQQPTNYFQKMAIWTEQGKVWQFPINNEQGLEDEQNVHFSEHIFLDSHLEGWCPTKGPIRHFMELVCVGLSKNPFYTAQEKKDHIMWYKEYFESKKDVLIDVGAWDVSKSTNNEASV